MASSPQVIIVGAGPYGLSVAANLRAWDIDFRIFGSLMETWRSAMPKGMSLKSDGYASNLSDPDAELTLEHFCAAADRPYAHEGIPVTLDTFVNYGLAFQSRFVPELEERKVVALTRTEDGFRATLDNGETVTAPQVVLAVGISHFAWLPPSLAGLPAELVSHSSRYHDLSRFNGRHVTVLGAGASAMDISGLLHEAGAEVEAVARTEKILFQIRTPLNDRPLLERLRAPNTGIGPGWRSYACAHAPQLYRLLPAPTRARLARTHIRPAAGWFMTDRVVGHVKLHEGCELTQATPMGSKLKLDLARGDGTRHEIVTEHLVAATGYKVDLRRLAFLDTGLRAALRSVENTPILTTHFESSVPGLHFVGAAAASSMGPMMRFVFGTDFTAQRLARHLAGAAARKTTRRTTTRRGAAPVRGMASS
ncbi:MAG TPA: NAD(P)-binding domain-containing protein [Stellaceae bacterium]|jgi:thioredoxin reductase|nr:NAD(P)-binding domain-containing protein [Stellaceae bacterium]